jgi:hypothetical protein
MIQKQAVNAPLVMGHQADPAHCTNFIFYRRICSTQYFTILFWDWGRLRIARIDSRRYNTYIHILAKFVAVIVVVGLIARVETKWLAKNEN